eukprot:31215_1
MARSKFVKFFVMFLAFLDFCAFARRSHHRRNHRHQKCGLLGDAFSGIVESFQGPNLEDISAILSMQCAFRHLVRLRRLKSETMKSWLLSRNKRILLNSFAHVSNVNSKPTCSLSVTGFPNQLNVCEKPIVAIVNPHRLRLKSPKKPANSSESDPFALSHTGHLHERWRALGPRAPVRNISKLPFKVLDVPSLQQC